MSSRKHRQSRLCIVNSNPKYGSVALFIFSAKARSLRGDSITDRWSNKDFVKEIMDRPCLFNEYTTRVLNGEVDSIQTSFKLLFTLQQ